MSDDVDFQGSTDVTEDVEHHLGGVACGIAGVEVQLPPEEPARFTVDVLEAEGGAVVDVALRSDGVTGRIYLEPGQARELADRLATAAAEAEEHRIDE